jgi:hypothetical protein
MTLLADLVLLVHAAYVLFVVGGLALVWIGYALGWRWVRNWWFRVLHLSAIGLVVLEAALGMLCPLTWLEDALRTGGGTGAGFIQRWVHAILFWDYPTWVFTCAYAAFALLVAGTFVVLRPRRRAGG